MSITFSGLATGLDTDSIVTQLMDLERAPINRLETKKTNETTRIEAYAQFKTTLDDLKSAVSSMNLTSQVKSTSVSLSTGAPFTATSANASSGSYNVAVKQLAQVQKTVSDGWTSQSEPLLGTGTFTLNNGTTDTIITVDSTNNSLAGLAAAINEKSADTGIKATLINDGTATPYRMVFTGVDSSSNFTVTSDLMAADGITPIAFATTQTQTAQQAKVMVDGIEVVSDSNTISGAISGVTLNLNAISDVESAGPPPIYKTSLMTVAPDTSALKEKLTTFVTSYNKVMEWILSGYNEFGSDTTTEDPEATKLLGSVLRGDSSINSVKRGLQSVLSSVIKTSGSSMSTLSELGITTQLNGTLIQDNKKMDAALQNNFDGVTSLLAGEDSVDGIMKKFNYFLLDVTSGTTGFYASKKKSYDLSVRRIDDQILNMEPRMVKKEATLRAQYTAMESLISGLNAQGSFLTQQMDLLSNMLKG
ncbi:MAG: flagellar filament capping protein FliD [Proteobacteria bacterium]|nr:flagellar filament capping protein FliD [Pseudomonadota bacterium]MBU1649813.1 flagellar filament capping protein FliD [Pseudomonadota bacterium]MBU1986350.1 flagellar filament capping protein FliD [Pseudomonadota bacterium]